MKRLFIIVNVDWFFLSHRLPIALEAKRRGFEVTILTGDTGRGVDIINHGLNFIPIPLQRSSTNKLKELITFLSIFKILLIHRPDVIHNVGLKPCLYGGIVSRFYNRSIVINAISGLGYLFTTDKIGFKQRLYSKVLKLGFHIKTKTIFQNPDDLRLFKKIGILNKISRSYIIKGSGVDIFDKYKFSPVIKKKKIVVLFPARILYTKGVKEFCLAANKVNRQICNIEFILIGDNDDQNLSSISENILYKWERDFGVKWLGYKSDMIPFYKESDIVVLPSYREGLPKSLIEACAIGRPIITTDAPGCRECVEEGVNGFLVPIKDFVVLGERILHLATDFSLRKKMGQSSRLLAEKEFSIKSVIDKTLALYE